MPVQPDLKQRLKQSAERRQAMLNTLGIVPLSILRPKRNSTLESAVYRLQHDFPERNVTGEDNKARSDEKFKALKAAGYTNTQTASGRKIGQGTLAASAMPPHLVEFFVKYYAQPGQVYLDPFMGQGIRLQVANYLGLHYWGYDASVEFCRYIAAFAPKLKGNTEVHTFNADSRYPDEIPDGIGDFSFYSPPYWDVEFYGDEPAQLGKAKTYEEFIGFMGQIAAAWLPKFKSGAYHCVNIGDFRRKTIFYPYQADLTIAYRAAGWQVQDIWILDQVVSGMNKAFAVQKNLLKQAPRIHEYAVIFKAP